ncbi:MAG: FAD-dependent oxidoreductase [Burkholderiales bacterium]|nr:MAG: FAD-dependent oxidoreductase [Burkholderiales bacterium]
MTARPPPDPDALSRSDPLQAALHGPLAAAGLPVAWRAMDTFVVLELGFGAGLSFLAALRAWVDDPARPARLHWAATLERPLGREALHAALASLRVASADGAPLLTRWPSALPGVHRLPFFDGRVLLSLSVGPAHTTVPGWVPRADALLLSYGAGDADTVGRIRNAFVAWRPAAACLAPGARAALSPVPGEPPSDSLRAARGIGRRALESAGFVMSHEHGSPGLIALPADSAQRLRGHAARSASMRGERPAGARSAMVVGAGLAGCATAFALARRGWSVLRLDAGSPRGSDQAVLAQHPSLTPDDAPLSRLTRAATLLAHGPYDVGALRRHGRVQVSDPEHAHAVAAHLPRDWVEPVDAAGASERAGVALRRGGWWLPMAGSADPRALCDAWTIAGITVRGGTAVATLARVGAAWIATDADGHVLGEAPVVVLACGAGGPAVVAAAGGPSGPLDACFGPAGLRRRTGMTTIAMPPGFLMPRCTVGGDGHAVPVDATRLLLGPAGGLDDDGSAAPGTADGEAAVRAWTRFASHLVEPGPRPALAMGTRGERMSTRDHLPLVGPVPDATAIAMLGRAARDDRLPLARLPDLWTATAFGGRGLLWSVLAAELIAARLDGEPAPLEHALASALSPDRFLRQARRRADTAG